MCYCEIEHRLENSVIVKALIAVDVFYLPTHADALPRGEALGQEGAKLLRQLAVTGHVQRVSTPTSAIRMEGHIRSTRFMRAGCGCWHVEADMKWGASTAGAFLLSSRLTRQRFWHCPLHNSRVRDTCSVSTRKKSKSLEVNRLHHTSIISAQGQAAVSTSAHLSSVLLLVVLCSWPFLLSLFFQTRLPKGQRKAETRLSQVRRGIAGWKWNKGGRSEFSFRSLCIFHTLYDSNPALIPDVGWFSTMWQIK